MPAPETIVRITRGPLAESVHRGHIAVVDSGGTVLKHVGDASYKTFARSTAKLLQAIPVIESGAAERYELSDKEIAIVCASHSGEQEHVETVRNLLMRADISPKRLQCGPHEPLYRPAAVRMRESGEKPTALHNNCSGKHTGMLLLAKHTGSPLESYMSPDHPVQRMMLETVSDMSGVPADEIALGTDGCGVPVFGLPLDKLAYAFARLGSGTGLSAKRAEACQRIVAAIGRFPYYLAGTDRFDTRLIEVTKGRLIGKGGAEGVFTVAVPDKGLGIALKAEDGNQRAVYPAVVETLKQLDLLVGSELEQLKPFHFPDIHNWSGNVVGKTEPAFRLRP